MHVPAPPTLAELETANTLLTMQQTTNQVQSMDADTTNNLNLQEPDITTADQLSELILDNVQTPSVVYPIDDLLDAMDKLVEHEDVSFSEPNYWLKCRDCMDVVTGRISDLVDVVTLDKLSIWDSTQTKPCRVELVQLKYTPTVKLPTLQTKQDLLALGEYFTRSKNKPRKPRKNRRPRSTHTDVNYEEGTSSSDQNKKRTSKKNKSAPPADGPTAAQVHAQKTTTQTPPVRLPALEVDKPADPVIESVPEHPPPTDNIEKDLPTPKRKGSFATRSFTLRKKKRLRKYGCKLCNEILDSAHLLTIHHRDSHGILYCETCNKAFNNPTSLV